MSSVQIYCISIQIEVTNTETMKDKNRLATKTYELEYREVIDIHVADI